MAGSVFVIPARISHVRVIAAGMRQADIEEVRASNGLEPEAALTYSLLASDEAWSVISPETGEPFAMFGGRGGTLLRPEGKAWLLSTDEIGRWRLPFAKHSRYYVREMARAMGDLTNYVDVRNVASIAWLKWLGAEFDEPAPHGAEGKDFQRFVIRREKICAE